MSKSSFLLAGKFEFLDKLSGVHYFNSGQFVGNPYNIFNDISSLYTIRK